MAIEAYEGTVKKKRLPKASDLLANELRAMILERGLVPGTPLPSEAELMNSHDYSRGTVREALRLLEAEGFISVTRGPKGGIRVQHPTVDLVSNSLATLLTLAQTPLSALFEFRKLVEPAAAALAANNATPEQKEELVAFTNSKVPDRGTISFHELLGNCTGNEMFKVILAAVNQVVGWQTGLENVSPQEVGSAGHAHEAIAKAISDGDATKASRLMLRHLESYEEVMRERGRLDQETLPRDMWVSYLRQTVPSTSPGAR